MLKHFPAWVIGVVTATAFVAYTMFVYFVLFLPLNIVKWLLPIPALRQTLTNWMIGCASLWADWNRACAQLMFAPEVSVHGADQIEPGKSYLIICNHQSWADIPLLGYVRPPHMPFPRFFLKYELIWVPIIGWACWAMDFPFMKRHSREEIARRPELAKEDLDTTRLACERFRGDQVNVMNYLEGTRFTEAKRLSTDSPFQYLLKPKSGGIAFTIGCMGDQFEAVIDMTIVYPPGSRMGLWNYLCGEHRKIWIGVQRREIPETLLNGDYQGDEQYRAAFRAWVDDIWSEKDARIGDVREQIFEAAETA